MTPWSNDPVINRPGEAFYVTDLESGVVSTPFAALSRRPSVAFEARHGLGYSTFTSEDEGLTLSLTQTVDRNRPVKLSRMTLRNTAALRASCVSMVM